MRGRLTLSQRLHDERGILIGALARLLIFLAILALVLYEGGAVIWARLSAQDIADSAATAAVTTYRDTMDVRATQAEAAGIVQNRDPDAEMTDFDVHGDGSVTVRVRKPASTIVIQHLGFLEGFTVARGAATIEPPDF